MEIKILVGRSVRPSGMVRLQPPSRLERKREAGQFTLHNANVARLIRKNITESDTLVAGGQFNCDQVLGCIAEAQPAVVQSVIHSRHNAREKFVLLLTVFDFSNLVNGQPLLKGLIRLVGVQTVTCARRFSPRD